MLSLPDMAVLGVLALLVFGEERLPGIVRQAGRMMREVQNTSHSFVREMERAADINEPVQPHADFAEISRIEPPAQEAAETAQPPAASEDPETSV